MEKQDLDNLFRIATESAIIANEKRHREINQQKAENARKNQAATDEVFSFCMKNLKNKILKASEQGKFETLIYSGAAYDRVGNVPNIFIFFGDEKIGDKIFRQLKVKSLRMLLTEYFGKTEFYYKMHLDNVNQKVSVLLRWQPSNTGKVKKVRKNSSSSVMSGKSSKSSKCFDVVDKERESSKENSIRSRSSSNRTN